MNAARITAILALLLVVASLGCRHGGRVGARTRTTRAIRDSWLGVLSSARMDAAELERDLAYARAVASGRAITAPSAAVRAAPRRVFLTFYIPEQPPLVVTALGETLGDSIARAAIEARGRLPPDAVERARIAIDVARTRGGTREGPSLGERLGRWGYVVESLADPSSAPGFVLPGELFTRHLLGEAGGPTLDRDALDALVHERLSAHCPCRWTAFETSAAVESSEKTSAMVLSRGKPPRPDPARLDAGHLLEHFRLGADFLARMVDAEGRFVYVYDAAEDREHREDYSIIRHAGATDALLEAYGELHDPSHLRAAERALDYLDRTLRTVAVEGGDDFTFLPDEDDDGASPIGGTGLSLIAFVEHAAVTRETKYLPRIRSMGRFLLRQLEENGHFAPYFTNKAPSGPVDDGMYYPGEAMLGLMRLYALDPSPLWLQGAERAARYRLAMTYASDRLRHRDYWFSLTLTELHRVTRDDAFATRAFEIAEGSMRDQDDDEADLARSAGSYDATPRASPMGTSLEAYAADVMLCRFMLRDRPEAKPKIASSGRSREAIFGEDLGRDETTLLKYSRAAASFIEWEQLDREHVFYARNPGKALGGVHGNPWGSEVRIDDVQHAMMGLLGLARALRDPTYGATGAPSPALVEPTQ